MGGAYGGAHVDRSPDVRDVEGNQIFFCVKNVPACPVKTMGHSPLVRLFIHIGHLNSYYFGSKVYRLKL